ncbi:MAG TPA: xanthine dehydrogenase family protein molybdopterin-binding subunit, partial [Casimicrobiaceae bacterium]|nr:xanthine dehydrogenase family protein molybdopterin-binding subunit [Casimicrobiaceae bacterium]
MSTISAVARFGSGKSVERVEDEALLTGDGRFVDDFSLPDQAVMIVLRSPHAHARIRSIDAHAAARMPGVIAIVTGQDLADAGVRPLVQSGDFKRADGSKTAAPPQHALAVDTVRFVGEGVAAIVAETKNEARDAAEAIIVDYHPRRHVIDVDSATANGAPHGWEEATGNVACEARHGDPSA